MACHIAHRDIEHVSWWLRAGGRQDLWLEMVLIEFLELLATLDLLDFLDFLDLLDFLDSLAPLPPQVLLASQDAEGFGKMNEI